MKFKVIEGTLVVEGDYSKEKRELKAAGRRLLLAFIAVLVIGSIYAELVIQVCAGMCMFVPN